MPIHDLGYRTWSGKISPGWQRSLTIAHGGIQVVRRNKWVRRVLYAAWLPTIVFAIFFFAYEKYVQVVLSDPAGRAAGEMFLEGMTEDTPEFAIIQSGLTTTDLGEGRHIIWSWLLATFLRIPQAIMTMLVVGMIAPPLISRDIRSRAFLLYFSRPLSRYEYVLGKGLIVAAFLSFITMLPALGCYLFGIALSTDPMAILDTWDLPIRIIVASLVFIIPAVSVSLMFSSLTPESRFAAFAWFATFGLGAIAWIVIFNAMLVGAEQRVNASYRAEQAARRESEKARLEQMTQVVPTRQDILDALANRESEDEESEAKETSQVIETNGRVIVIQGDSDDGKSWEDRVHRDRYGREYKFRNGRMAFLDPRDYLYEREREQRMMEERERIRNHPLSLVSMYDTLVRLQRWVFGLETDYRRVLPAGILVCFVTGFSWFVLLRRVTAPIRI